MENRWINLEVSMVFRCCHLLTIHNVKERLWCVYMYFLNKQLGKREFSGWAREKYPDGTSSGEGENRENEKSEMFEIGARLQQFCTTCGG